MGMRKPGPWWKFDPGHVEFKQPGVLAHEKELQRRAASSVKHPRYRLHLAGLALLMTQSKLVYAATGVGAFFAWGVGMLWTLAAAAAAAGLWHVVKRPTFAQTGRHFLTVSWVFTALIFLGSYL